MAKPKSGNVTFGLKDSTPRNTYSVGINLNLNKPFDKSIYDKLSEIQEVEGWAFAEILRDALAQYFQLRDQYASPNNEVTTPIMRKMLEDQRVRLIEEMQRLFAGGVVSTIATDVVEFDTDDTFLQSMMGRMNDVLSWSDE